MAETFQPFEKKEEKKTSYRSIYFHERQNDRMCRYYSRRIFEKIAKKIKIEKQNF